MAGRETPFPRFTARGREAVPGGWAPVELGGHEVVARLSMELQAGPTAAAEGRHALDPLEGTLPGHQLDELRLLVTELLTNSVRHGSSEHDWIMLEIEIFANAVRVVVTDRGPGFDGDPVPQPHGDRAGGWGLCLVDRLADRWGVERDRGTSVWFEVDRDNTRFATAA